MTEGFEERERRLFMYWKLSVVRDCWMPFMVWRWLKWSSVCVGVGGRGGWVEVEGVRNVSYSVC